ncbi:MAG: hypothetical protein WD801_06610 [Gemmatimonadaceae bacterium]
MRIDCVNCATSRRRQSRNRLLRLLLSAALVVLASVPAGAQDVSDSLAIRLRRAENAIAVLQRQLAEQAERGVATRSGLRVELNGRVAVNGFANDRRVNNVDNPQFVRPDNTPGVPVQGAGMAIRQTTLGLAVTAPAVLGGAFTGDVDVDFYGGQVPSGGGRTFPLLRLRTARAQVRWTNWHLLVGQESPLISALNPVSPAAVGTPAFAAAGNLWLWLPQIRVGRETGGNIRVGMQGAIVAPTSGDPAAAFDTDYDLAESANRPFLQSRAYVKWGGGEAELAGELGCGVHQGWLMPAAARVPSSAFACDAMLPVVEWLEVRGEYFRGQALRGLGGGGIGQNFNTSGDPLHTSGGWAQINLRPRVGLRVGVGCGVDHPADGPARQRNQACSTYTIVRPSGPLFFGGELRRIVTGYAGANHRNDHVTIVTGFEF